MELTGAPIWLTALIGILSLITGGLVAPLLTNSAEGRRLRSESDDRFRDDLSKQLAEAHRYHAEIKAEADQVRRDNARLFSMVVDITTSFNEFQMMMLRETIQVSILLDTKDTETANARLDSLIKHIRSLQVGFPTWSDPS